MSTFRHRRFRHASKDFQTIDAIDGEVCLLGLILVGFMGKPDSQRPIHAHPQVKGE